MIKFKKAVQYYDTLDILPLYNFDKYRTTSDLNWFLVGFDGRQKKQIDPKLKTIESSILDQYFKAVGDRSFSSKLKKWGKIEELKFKYNICKSLVKRISLGFSDDQAETRILFIKELKSHGFAMPEINTTEGDIDNLIRLDTGIEGLKTKIELIKIEIGKEEIKGSANLTKQLQIATIGLGYNYRLNPKEITVSEWIEITKLLEEKSKDNE